MNHLHVTERIAGNRVLALGFCFALTVAVHAQGFATTILGDGTPGAGERKLHFPTGLTIDGEDNLFVADTYNHRIQKLAKDGTVSTVLGTGTSGAGPGELFFPRAVALDGGGNLYVADAYHHRVQRISKSGDVATVLGGQGQGSSAAHLSYPRGVAVDAFGDVYVGDTYNNRLQRVQNGGIVTTLFDKFSFPHGVAIGVERSIYVADMLNQRIMQLAGGQPPSVLLGGPEAGSGPRSLRNPGGVAADRFGSIYVVDTNNNRVQMLLPSGFVWTVAGTGGQGPAASQLDSPYAAAVDSTGNLYIADTNNHRIQRLRKIVVPRDPEIRSAATDKMGPGSPNQLMRLSHPLPCAGDISVVAGGYPAPLRRINGVFVEFMIPAAVDPGVPTEVYFLCDGVSLLPMMPLQMAEANLGLFSDEGAFVRAESADGSRQIGAESPAERGEEIVLLATGLGLLREPDQNGNRPSVLSVTATVGGVVAAVTFGGTTSKQEPGYFQIKLKIPDELGSGRHDIVVQTDGLAQSVAKGYLAVK